MFKCKKSNSTKFFRDFVRRPIVLARNNFCEISKTLFFFEFDLFIETIALRGLNSEFYGILSGIPHFSIFVCHFVRFPKIGNCRITNTNMNVRFPPLAIRLRPSASVFRLRRYGSGLWPPFSTFGDTSPAFGLRFPPSAIRLRPSASVFRLRRYGSGLRPPCNW